MLRRNKLAAVVLKKDAKKKGEDSQATLFDINFACLSYSAR